MSDIDVKARVQQQFGTHAQSYVESMGHAKGADLGRMLALAALQGTERVLDIATGGGHTALAFAPQAREVVASDLTPAMLAAAEQFIRAQGVANVSFELADAEALPFPDSSFDVVTVRIAPHHFPNPAQFVREVARVLRSSGLFVFDDNVAPEDAELGAFINRVEQWRDGSHVRCLPVSEWHVLMEAAGLRIEHTEAGLRKHFDFADWVERVNMPSNERQALEAWMIEAPEHVRDAFTVAIEHGRVKSFSGEFAIIVARKVEISDRGQVIGYRG